MLRRRGEPDRAQPAMRRTDQVTQLVTGMARRSPRMLARNQLGPQLALVRRFHRNQPKPRNPVDPVRNARRQRHRMPQTPWPTAAAAVAGRLQLDQPGSVEFAQDCRATRLLQPTAGVAEPERLADPAGRHRATVARVENRAQSRLPFGGIQGAPDLILFVHEPVIDGRIEFV